METDFKKTFWSDAAKAGLVLGLATALFSVVSWALKLDVNMLGITSFVNFALIAVCVYYFGKKRANESGDKGFSYGESMSYIFTMMLFAGFIAGVGGYIMNNFVAPEYYKEIMDAAILKSSVTVENTEIDQAMTMAKNLMKNAPFIIMNSMFSMVVYGCFIGIIASIFIKRNPTESNDGKNAE